MAAISLTAVACKKQGGGGGEEGTEGLLYEYNEITDSYQVSAGEAENEKRIVVPGTHKDKPGTAIASRGFANCATESIVLPTSITSIGQSAFSGCVALTSVTLPENPTSIGGGAFSGCYNLQPSKSENGAQYLGSSQNPYLYLWEVTDKTITDFTIVEGTAFIDSNAFSYCNKLQTVNWNAVDCKVVSGYFRLFDSQSLTTVNIGDNVKVIPQNVFAECAKLQPSKTTSNAKYLGNSENPYLYLWEVTDKSITNFTVNGKTKIIGGSAVGVFFGCDRLTSITIPLGVTSIGGSAFFFCTNLQTVTFAGDSKLESIGDNAFQQCSKLTEITIPLGVTSIGGSAFSNCSNLRTITFAGDSKLESIGEWAFQQCSNLTSITIPASVTSIGANVFSGCSSLESISVAPGNRVYSSQDGILYNYAKTAVVYSPAKIKGAVTIPESVTSIGGGAFSGCSGLTSITIHANVTSINSDAFSGCSSLERIDVAPGNKTYSSLDGILYNYGKTEIIRVPGGKKSVTIPASVTSIGNYAFSGCSGLTSITIPANVTYISSGAFDGCSSLERIDVAPGNKTYSSLDGILYNYGKTTIVHVPRGIKGAVTIPNGITSIGDMAFSDRSGLTSITIPESVTSIGGEAFYGCTNLNTVNWNATNCTEVMAYSYHPIFYGCTSLTTVNIGENVQTIPAHMFSDCSNLTSITIPESVTSIGNYAFSGCTGLQAVDFKNPVGWEVSYSGDMSSADDICKPTCKIKRKRQSICGIHILGVIGNGHNVAGLSI